MRFDNGSVALVVWTSPTDLRNDQQIRHSMDDADSVDRRVNRASYRMESDVMGNGSPTSLSLFVEFSAYERTSQFAFPHFSTRDDRADCRWVMFAAAKDRDEETTKRIRRYENEYSASGCRYPGGLCLHGCACAKQVCLSGAVG